MANIVKRSKKKVKFSDMSTFQKVVHGFGWYGIITTGIVIVGVATGSLLVSNNK